LLEKRRQMCEDEAKGKMLFPLVLC